MKDIFVLPEKPAFLDNLTDNGVKVVVVSIIGKSSYSSFGQKVRPLGKVFDFTTESKSECRIEGSYDDEKQIIYLHLYSLLDSVNLLEHYSALSERCKEQNKNCDFLTVYNEVKSSSARALLLLFHVSHIVILSHPGNSLDFDVNYIQIFKSLDSIRQKCLGQISEVLRTVTGLNPEWVTHGRPCTPRLVFYFERCPKHFRANISSTQQQLNIKKLEHEIEDRIYHILRKVRIVGNTNCNSLFAIPANQEYVYINVEGEGNASRLTHAVKQLVREPMGPPSFPFAVQAPPVARALHRFLAVHTDLAFSKGFDDCVGTGRHAHHHTAYFEVPTIEQWFDATISLYKFFIPDNDEENNLVLSSSLLGILYTDTKFSEQRCQKVLPLALARYQEGLAAQYTRAHHDTRLALAGAVFAAQARGPLFATFAHDLHAKCEAHWAAGRQLCEALSLTGNPCTLPRNHEPTTPEHHSGVRYVAACDCGRKQGSRDDPYTVKHANLTFYQQLAQECACGKSNTEKVIFPIFQPSTDEYRAASAATAAPAASDPEPEPEPEPDLSQTSGLSSLEPAPPHTSPEHETVLQLVPDDNDKDKNLVRQPSTTEYLAGMLTSASPASLLPQFPSWSLVCLGASSLYSHNLGLSDAQHPGFLPATNFLLPWDVTVRLERGTGGWPAVNKCSMGAPRARRARPHHGLAHFVVKIFVGAEYECPRGHRFMLASPDKVLRATAGIVKETGHKITNSDMPLYYNCPCRPNKPLVAQLMRIHVVTPKAPVFVTLNPKVQPAPNAPIFVPRLDGSVRISQSAYWILRLPYVYATDRETFIANRQTADSAPRLLAGMWGVAESD